METQPLNLQSQMQHTSRSTRMKRALLSLNIKHPFIPGFLLVFLVAMALLIENISNGKLSAMFQSEALFQLHKWTFKLSFQSIINQGLMTFFFLLIGLEIKHELNHGELASSKKATLPIIAAIFGMIVPALIYLLLNKKTPFEQGFGIPIATDIAFSIGILSLFSGKISNNLRITLMAIAVADDIFSIIIIAIFYSHHISPLFMMSVFFFMFLLFLLHKKKVSSIPLFFLLLLPLFGLLLASGIEPTLAGVIIGFSIPSQSHKPAQIKCKTALYIASYFFILPLFAFSNSAVLFPEHWIQEAIHSSVFWGIFFGLVFGKPIGIFGSAWITQKIGITRLPSSSNLFTFLGISCLGGIGFTISLYIASLSFTDTFILGQAKMAILLASSFSTLLGVFFLFIGFEKKNSS